MSHFMVPLAKNENGKFIMEKIHADLYKDEQKTNRFDLKFVQTLLFLMYKENKYDVHIRILKVPVHIKDRCSVAYDDSLVECIYLMPNYTDDPSNKDKELIQELSYNEVKSLVHDVINQFKKIKSEYDADASSQSNNK